MPALQEPPTQVLDLSALLSALNALKRGDFSARLPMEWTGVAGKVADTFNDVIELNERMARELERWSAAAATADDLEAFRAEIARPHQPKYLGRRCGP